MTSLLKQYLRNWYISKSKHSSFFLFFLVQCIIQCSLTVQQSNLVYSLEVWISISIFLENMNKKMCNSCRLAEFWFVFLLLYLHVATWVTSTIMRLSVGLGLHAWHLAKCFFLPPVIFVVVWLNVPGLLVLSHSARGMVICVWELPSWNTQRALIQGCYVICELNHNWP